MGVHPLVGRSTSGTGDEFSDRGRDIPMFLSCESIPAPKRLAKFFALSALKYLGWATNTLCRTPVGFEIFFVFSSIPETTLEFSSPTGATGGVHGMGMESFKKISMAQTYQSHPLYYLTDREHLVHPRYGCDLLRSPFEKQRSSSSSQSVRFHFWSDCETIATQ